MNRRAFLCGLTLGALATPVAGDAQQIAKVYRIGWLAPTPLGTTLDAFRYGLRVLGYVEGNNLVIEQRYVDGRPERLNTLVAELVAGNADVLLTTGNQTTEAAKIAGVTTPIVFIAGDPVEAGFVASLAHPGGNMTGVNTLPTELNTKRLEVLKEAFHKLLRVAVLFEPRHLSRSMPRVEAAARSLGLQLMRLAWHL